MVVDLHRLDRPCRTAVRRLAVRFGGRPSTRVGVRIVADARLDREGRIQPEALAGMVHRLARHRLDAVITART